MSASCVIPYVRDILRRTTRPHRVSWFAFALLSSFAAAAQLAGGLAAGALLSLGAAVGFSVVFVLSLKFGVGGTTTGQQLQILGTVGAVVIWAATDNAVVAVLLVCSIEVVAIVPTVRKAYRDPRTETLSTWVIDGASGAVAAVSALSFAAVIYPIHHLLVNGVVVAAVTAGRSREIDRVVAPRANVGLNEAG